MDETFGEDVYPAVVSGWVGGWSWEGVSAVGGVGECAGSKWICDVRGFGI
jgi:hypothetical protein